MLFSLIWFAMALTFVPNNFYAISYEIKAKIYYDLELSESIFNEFIVEYNKYYTDEEYAYRLTVFEENLKSINELNKQHAKTVFGITRFSDLTNEEFKSHTSCLRLGLQLDDLEEVNLSHKEINVPDSLDYRNQNRVTAVKDQSNCGSCFIFCAIGEIEGQYASKHTLTSLSEQYPLDCNDNYDCDNGGDPDEVMQWLATTKGALTLKDYPDEGDQSDCTANASLGIAQVKSSKRLVAKDNNNLKQLLVDHGPLGIGIAANHKFGGYVGGVIDPDCDGTEDLNHGVVLVGYGKDGEDDYWLIKNSWGADWGENGYVRVAAKANCGVGSYIATSEVL